MEPRVQHERAGKGRETEGLDVLDDQCGDEGGGQKYTGGAISSGRAELKIEQHQDRGRRF